MRIRLAFITIFHPYIYGQSKKIIKKLENMLRACVLDIKILWSNYLPLIKFTYNNSNQTIVEMIPFKVLYA